MATENSSRRARVLGVAAVAILITASNLAAQDGGTITGRVTDTQSGQPIAAAQVFIADLDLGGLTQSNGRYLLQNVPVGTHTLSIARIGYRTTDVQLTVSGGATVEQNFAIAAEALALDEIIVTGTPGGTQRRAIGNAVARLDATQIVELSPVGSIQDLLQGREPGVVFSRAIGQVGAGAMPRIRGTGSISQGDRPLLYVDGIRVSLELTGPSAGDGRQGVSLNDFNPNDIESIEIIKGPAAATLYGTEASAGVIQIITKKGRSGATQFDFSIRQGANWMMNPAGKVGTVYGVDQNNNVISANLYKSELAGNAMFPEGRSVFETGYAQSYTLSMRGGTDEVRYFLSTEWDDQVGIVPYNYDEHLNFRANVSLVPLESLSLDVSTGYVGGVNRIARLEWDGMMWGTPSTLNDVYRGFFRGPPEDLATRELIRDYSRFTVSGTLTHRAGPLTQRLIVGRDLPFEENLTLTPRHPLGAQHVFGKASEGRISVETRRRQLMTLDYSASANYSWNDDLSFTSSFGVQYYASKLDANRASGQEFPSPAVRTLSAAADITSATQVITENKSLGMYLQQEFNYRDRIFLTAAIRGDDSSAFGTSYDAALYPKLSGTWSISDEDFWSLDVVNSLRFRSAWGKAGRQPDTFAAVTLYKPVVASGGGPGVAPRLLGNPELGPEVSTELEVGFDVALFDDRLSAEFTYYTQKLKDALVSNPIAPSVGFPGSQSVNLGKLSNRGWELSVSARVIEEASYGLELGAGISHNTNQIEDLGGRLESSTFRVGYPFPAFAPERIVSAEWLDPVNGIGGLTTNCMIDGGMAKDSGLKDANGDAITYLVPGGDPVPCDDNVRLLMGSYRPEWDLRFDGTIRIFNNLRIFAMVEMPLNYWSFNHNVSQRHSGFANSFKVFNRVEDNDPVYIAAVVDGDGSSGGLQTSRYDASFAKLREVSATYYLPPSLTDRLNMSRASISVAGRDLWTIWVRQKFVNGVRVPDPESRSASETSTGATFPQPPLSSFMVTMRVSF